MLKEEKLLVASSQWGSFFTHPRDTTTKQPDINTFWGDLVRRYSKLAIPLLDYIAGSAFVTIRENLCYGMVVPLLLTGRLSALYCG